MDREERGDTSTGGRGRKGRGGVGGKGRGAHGSMLIVHDSRFAVHGFI